MAGKLLAEIRQTKPFELIEEEAVLNIHRTAEVLGQAMTELLKDYQLSNTQYNVLRILRGAGRDGATCSGIADRMINHDPDITRLLDRLEGRGLVSRVRSTQDRRVVITTITTAGVALLGVMDAPVRGFLRASLGGMDRAALATLIEQLEQVRDLFANVNDGKENDNGRHSI